MSLNLIEKTCILFGGYDLVPITSVLKEFFDVLNE
jgi:hypothetical protein